MQRTSVWIAGIAACVPWVLLVYMLLGCAMTFPYYSAWHFAGVVARSYAGTLGLADLWASAEGQRVLFPQLLLLLLARLSGWNGAWEIALNLGLGVAIYLSMLYLLRHCARVMQAPLPLWLPALLALFHASFVQFENWTWGWQAQALLSILFALWSLIALVRASEAAFVLAVLLALGAAFSQAHGLAVFVGGLPLLLLDPARTRGVRLLHAGLWLIAAGVAAWCCAGAAGDGVLGTGAAAIAAHPLRAALYFAGVLGVPVGRWMPPIAMIAGATLLGAAAFLAVYLWIRRRPEIHGWLPLAAVGLYVVAGVAGIVWLRLPLGMQTAMISRYATLSILLWGAVLGTLTIALRGRTAYAVAAAVCAGLIPPLLVASVQGRELAQRMYLKALPGLAQAAMHPGEDSPHLASYVHDFEVFREASPVLAQHGLSFYGGNRDDLVLEISETYLDRVPDVAEHLRLGAMFREAQRYDLAEQHLRYAVQREPQNPDALFQLSLLLSKTDRKDEATRVIEEALRLQRARRGETSP
jgi:tetratricopeptide (TPR) repeat protein